MIKLYPFKYKWLYPDIKPINENVWFRVNQSLLLSMINSYVEDENGERFYKVRELLCIDQDFPEITEFAKNYIRCVLPNGETKTEFHGGAKWANVIRFRWLAFSSVSKEFYDSGNKTWVEIDGELLLAATTSTFYPEPDVATTAGDGNAGRVDGAGITWNDIRTGVGTQADASGVQIRADIDADTVTDRFDAMFRSAIAFDTSSLPDGDTISSATFSIYGISDQSDLETPTTRIVSVSRGDVTTMVASDYNIANWGSAGFAPDLAGGSWTNSAYNDYDLNSTGLANIDKAGVSDFGLRMASDADDTEPTWISATRSRVFASSADETGTTQDPKLVVIHTTPTIVTPDSLVLTATMPDPTISAIIIVDADVLTLTTTLPQALAQTVLVPVDALTLTTTLPAPTVDAPIIIVPDALVLTISMPDPTIASQTALIVVHNFPVGKIVEYRITDEFGVTLQDWTSVGVTELVVDVTADKSNYYTKSNLVSGTSQLILDWRDDSSPIRKTASGSVDIYLSKVVGIEEDIATKLDVAVSTRLADTDYTAPDNTGIDFIETWILNRLKIESTQVILYADDGITPLKTWPWNPTTKDRGAAT